MIEFLYYEKYIQEILNSWKIKISWIWKANEVWMVQRQVLPEQYKP